MFSTAFSGAKCLRSSAIVVAIDAFGANKICAAILSVFEDKKIVSENDVGSYNSR